MSTARQNGFNNNQLLMRDNGGWGGNILLYTCDAGLQWYVLCIDVLNKDCRRSISAILTWVLENVKISARPLNSIGN